MGFSLYADMLLTNGPVYVAYGQAYAQAVAIKDGKVLATGSAEELAPLKGPDTKLIDLEGRMAVPAFNDCHLHMISLGRSLGEVNLSPQKVKSIPEALTEIKKQADAANQGEWIYGGRYDHFEFAEKRHPTIAELDSVAPNNPVYLKRRCGHVGVGNSLAFRAAGIDANTPDPEGGHIQKLDGELTGQLQETAQRLVMDQIPPLTLDEVVTAIEDAAKHMLSFGVASIMDAGVGMNEGMMDMAGFQMARRDKRLHVRSYLTILAGPSGIMEQCSPLGLITGTGDDMLRIGPAKLFADGSTGGHTAAMTTPYLNDGDNKGLFIYSDREMNDMVADYVARGYQIATHTIGDAAIEQVLTAYERAITNDEIRARRHRLEHCGFVTEDQLQRMQKANILPIPQPCFFNHFSDLYADAVGEELTSKSYPMRTWVERSMYPGASTDTPVCPPDTLPNIAAMMTRKGPSGKIYGADQTIDLDRAIEAMTFNGAYAAHEENIKGRLLPGQLADIAVIDRDISQCDAETIRQSHVDMTIVGGEIAFDRNA
ncbi:hypothetical protein ATL17_1082 [Maritalea mobilis]|uniref:Amidohydrolase 3 domain-containing protein n=1 Tax=Maritalea mobilis TaxID=483324 RepID=A0A4R6W278_9HYPH|nr:amidohydrolase [Maritalea mobilis]TDQ67075.1 hypothetical protein ATL17_1082 [Maritalea mobilis]